MVISPPYKTDIPHPDTVTHPDATVDLPAREPGMEPGTSTWADSGPHTLTTRAGQPAGPLTTWRRP